MVVKSVSGVLGFGQYLSYLTISSRPCDAVATLILTMFRLSKERPILGDHPKAHIHEIRQISREICQISCRFHEIQQISCGFHEIWQISCRFHEIQWISGEIWQISCGFYVKSARFHVKSTYKTYKSNISRKSLQFYGVLWEGYVMFSHEICRISRNRPDFERPIARNGKPCVSLSDEMGEKPHWSQAPCVITWQTWHLLWSPSVRCMSNNHKV